MVRLGQERVRGVTIGTKCKIMFDLVVDRYMDQSLIRGDTQSSTMTQLKKEFPEPQPKARHELTTSTSLFRPYLASKKQDIAHKDTVQPRQDSEFRIVTYNCKNMETTIRAIDELSKTTDVLLIQEHWYFDCQQNKLCDINNNMTGKGKVVDTNDPILPVLCQEAIEALPSYGGRV